MISIADLQGYIQQYDSGDRSENLQSHIFKAVLQTRADGDDDIEEMEDLDEAVRYLKVRLLHNHYRS